MRGAHLVSLGARGPSRALCGEEARHRCGDPSRVLPRPPGARRVPHGAPPPRTAGSRVGAPTFGRVSSTGNWVGPFARAPQDPVTERCSSPWGLCAGRGSPPRVAVRTGENPSAGTEREAARDGRSRDAAVGSGVRPSPTAPPSSLRLGFPAWRLMKGPRSSPWPVASMLSPTGRLEGPSWPPFLSAGVWRRLPLGRAAKDLV